MDGIVACNSYSAWTGPSWLEHLARDDERFYRLRRIYLLIDVDSNTDVANLLAPFSAIELIELAFYSELIAVDKRQRLNDEGPYSDEQSIEIRHRVADLKSQATRSQDAISKWVHAVEKQFPSAAIQVHETSLYLSDNKLKARSSKTRFVDATVDRKALELMLPPRK